MAGEEDLELQRLQKSSGALTMQFSSSSSRSPTSATKLPESPQPQRPDCSALAEAPSPVKQSSLTIKGGGMSRSRRDESGTRRASSPCFDSSGESDNDLETSLQTATYSEARRAENMGGKDASHCCLQFEDAIEDDLRSDASSVDLWPNVFTSHSLSGMALAETSVKGLVSSQEPAAQRELRCALSQFSAEVQRLTEVDGRPSLELQLPAREEAQRQTVQAKLNALVNRIRCLDTLPVLCNMQKRYDEQAADILRLRVSRARQNALLAGDAKGLVQLERIGRQLDSAISLSKECQTEVDRYTTQLLLRRRQLASIQREIQALHASSTPQREALYYHRGGANGIHTMGDREGTSLLPELNGEARDREPFRAKLRLEAESAQVKENTAHTRQVLSQFRLSYASAEEDVRELQAEVQQLSDDLRLMYGTSDEYATTLLKECGGVGLHNDRTNAPFS